ncbi:MAG: GUN4 domain-containing protein [Brasilonema angustatum HA4187-MV1]|jgi:hypothetical protein|nr:GUN4 domain-containing protein [Brasilonema angustatum HA4187-MV1]
MSQQDLLTESDVDTLINLLLRSQQSRTREALCFSIGIDPKRLSFLRDSSDSDFFLLLIRYLNEIGDQEALCKLCNKELIPIFNKGTYGNFLEEIAKKLNCNLELRQNYPNNKAEEQLNSRISSSTDEFNFNILNQVDVSEPQSWLKKIFTAKYKLFAGGVVLLIGFTGFYFYEQNISYSPEYAQLQSLLKNKNWKMADEETAKKMLEVSGKQKENWLNSNDLAKFPCEDLRTIDKLWIKYSDGKFGFTVQKRIWEDVGGIPTKVDDNISVLEDFAQKVGWRKRPWSPDNNLKYQQISPDDIYYNINAPKGHLPTVHSIGVWWFGYGNGGGIGGSSLSVRLEQCNIH